MDPNNSHSHTIAHPETPQKISDEPPSLFIKSCIKCRISPSLSPYFLSRCVSLCLSLPLILVAIHLLSLWREDFRLSSFRSPTSPSRPVFSDYHIGIAAGILGPVVICWLSLTPLPLTCHRLTSPTLTFLLPPPARGCLSSIKATLAPLLPLLSFDFSHVLRLLFF
jgi:hypothetical protein